MAHRALALKYRPQVFSDLVGQEHVTGVLMRAVENGRVAQAYLFTGARGVGKTTSARVLAKSLNCERRASGQQKGADPCNLCTSCTEITSGVSLDVAEIDGASNRGIADVQALREKVRFSPTGGHYRVVIIDEVHQLSGDAFAALLKTLEEPPPHLVFIFATTDPQKLPDTIRSRTQRFDFARVPLRKVADRLIEIQKREQADPDGTRFALTEGAALLIAHKSEGSMRDAVSALDQVVSAGEATVDEALVRRVLGIPDREVFYTLAGAIVARDPAGSLKALHTAFAKGLDPRDLADGLSEHIRHLLVLKVDPQADDLVAVSAEDLVRLREQTEGWSEHDLLRLLRIASEASWPMRDSPQPLIHLEAAVMQMATLEPGERLAELLQRLEALEQRLGGGGTPGGSSPAPRASSVAGASSGSPALARTAPRAFAAPASAPAASRPIEARAPIAPPASVPSAPAAPARAAEPRASTATAVLDDTLVLDDALLATWKTALAGVNSKKRMLGAFLHESRILGVSGDHLVLAMDDLHRAVVDEQENRAIIAAEVARAFGRTLGVRCVAPPAGEVKRPPTEADMRPSIDQAIAWFDGEVVEPRAPEPRAPKGERIRG